MKKIFYTIIIIIGISSCIEEYQIFYPYKNTSISYLNKLQDDKVKVSFSPNSDFEYIFEQGLLFEMNKEIFDSNIETINLSLSQINTPGKVIANRISLNSTSKQMIKCANIIDFSFSDNDGNILSPKSGSFVKIKIPYFDRKVPSIFRLTDKGWVKTTFHEEHLVKSTWEIIEGEQQILMRGYIFSTDKPGLFCLGTEINEHKDIDKIRISLPNGFDVSNSVVQMTFPRFHTNLELYWDGESKTFELPESIQIPDNEVNIVVLSENANKQAFFGMKNAVLNNGDIIKVDVSKKTIEDIKNILKNL